MNAFFSNFSRPSRPLIRFFKILTLLFALIFVFPFFGCSKQKEVDYFDYVSELRSNILLAESDGLTLRVYGITKEYPYATDGVPRDTTTRAEFFLVAPSGDQEYHLSFTVNGENSDGDMSYDNVKAEYYFSRALNIESVKEIPCVITCGEKEISFTARSVVDDTTYTPKKALQTLVDVEKPLFEEWTDEYGFIGEIYLRLIHEDAPYYYIGLIDRNGKIVAFFMNAETGKVLAKREQ